MKLCIIIYSHFCYDTLVFKIQITEYVRFILPGQNENSKTKVILLTPNEPSDGILPLCLMDTPY